MACAAQHPLFLNDLSHSQYLWPIPSTNLDELVADTHLRNEYKHQVESKLAYSDAFRKQFLLFAEQFLYELKRNQGQGLDGFDLSRLATPIGGGDCTDGCCATASVADQSPHLRSLPSSPSPRAVAPPTSTSKHHKFRLVDPPPRLSSPLTPNPCGTLLRGDEPRRPMPRRRHHVTPLLKQVLEKMIEPEYRQRKRTRSKSKTRTGGIDEDQDRGVYQRLDPMFDGLGSGWVVVPEEEWEMVTEGCMTTSMIL